MIIAGIVLYSLSALIAARAIAGALAYDVKSSPGPGDWAVGWALGVLTGPFWPVIVGGLAIGKLWSFSVEHLSRLNVPTPALYVGNEYKQRRLRQRSLGLRGISKFQGRVGDR
jgi:hypothetical protein